MKCTFKVATSFLLVLLLISTGLAQGISENRPIGLTAEEKEHLHEIGATHKSTKAPIGEIRNVAEWEPSEGVIIRYPLGIPLSIVAEMAEDLTVTVIVANSSYQSSAISDFNSAGVDMTHVRFLFASTNSYWTRDYGPWFIFEDKEMAIVDHIYNRPRPLDDVIPQALGTDWGMTVYGMDLITTGGNHMSDGLGISMSTVLVYNENPSLTENQVDSIMYEYLNNDYTVLNYIESGGIHHIDCWAKFLNPGTILVKDVPTSSSSYNLLNARADALSQQISAWGIPYNVVRVYCPFGTAYTNSIILNDKVLVPTFGVSADADALQTYRDAMPGYEVIGFTGSWLDDDAIHCRTMGVPDREMLRIHHVPLAGEIGNGISDYQIDVLIQACSDSALITDSLKVIYQVDGGAWQDELLTATATTDWYTASIPAQTAGNVIRYYIQAADLSDRVETHPFIGEPWAHEFVAGGPHPPEAAQPVSPVTVDTLPVFSALPTLTWETAEDPDEFDEVTYTVTLSDSAQTTALWESAEMPDTSCVVGVSLDYNTWYSWKITTHDLTGLTNESDAQFFRVYTLGDFNFDEVCDIGDLNAMINFLFISFEPIEPSLVGDLTQDCIVDIADLTKLINHLFISFIELEPGC